jgi:hypothetical protein
MPDRRCAFSSAPVDLVSVAPRRQTHGCRGTWTHTLGYRGHILTKSRAYSTTYAALGAERAAHHVGHADIPDAVPDRHWRYVGSGHTEGAALLAAGIAEDIATNREMAREEREARR